MNKKIKIPIAAIGMCAFLWGGVVPALAQSGDTAEEQATEIMQQQQSSGRLSEQQLQELEQRLKKRKESLKLQLNSVEKARLQTRCEAAQGALSSLQGRIKGIQTSRTQVYGNLTERLKSVSEKLAAKGLNTTELDQAIAELEAKIVEFNTALVDYIQAVSDLALMQCKQDAEGFKASLEQARAEQQKLREAGLAIKTIIQDKIKPILVELRAQLEEASDSGEGSE